LLWLFAMDQAPGGDVGKWTDHDIEAELGWEGQECALVAALVEAGWLDRCQDNRLVIHDWADHLPEFIKKRVSRGAVTLAVACPPLSADVRHCLPLSADVSHREGKGREGKVREGKLREGKGSPSADGGSAKTPALRKPSKRKTAVPEYLSAADAKLVTEWASRRSPPISEAELRYAWSAYSSKAKAKGYTYVDHAAGFRNALGAAGEAWALKGYGSTAPVGESPAEGRQRRTRENTQKALELLKRREADRLKLVAGGK
jgi:hypothetical protein